MTSDLLVNPESFQVQTQALKQTRSRLLYNPGARGRGLQCATPRHAYQPQSGHVAGFISVVALESL